MTPGAVCGQRMSVDVTDNSVEEDAEDAIYKPEQLVQPLLSSSSLLPFLMIVMSSSSSLLLLSLVMKNNALGEDIYKARLQMEQLFSSGLQIAFVVVDVVC